MMRGVLAALFVIAGGSGAAGDTVVSSPTPSPTPTAVPEIGRVTTSDRQSEPIGRTSRPTFVIDRAQIEAYGARTIADALVGVPGVELFHYGPFGAQVDYGIRGALSTQTLVLVDGMPITDPTTGTVLINQLSTIGVQRIEVVESGASTLYGSNASGGVINIITDVPRGLYLLGSTGSFGDRDLRVAAGTPYIGAAFERHVSIGDYPYPQFVYGPATIFPGAARYNTYGDMTAARISVNSGRFGAFQARLRVDLTATGIGVPGRLDFLTPNATQTTNDNDALLEIERDAPNSTLTLSLGGATHRLAYVDPSSTGENDTYTGRAQISLKDVFSLQRFDVVSGIDLARESGAFSFPANFSGTGSPPAITAAAQSQAALYLQAGYAPFAHSHIVAGVRAENDGGQGSVVDPAFGGVLQFGALRLAGNVAETFRVPTLQDLYFPGFANPNLVPERAQASDVTIATTGRRTVFSLGWFARSGSNFIVFDPVLNIPVNEQRAQTAGLAATANFTLPAGLSFSVGLTDLYQAINVVTGARLPRSPVGQAVLSLAHPFGTTRFEYGARWNAAGSSGDDGQNVPVLLRSYDSYATLDAYLRYKIAPNLIVSARGFNLTNQQYAPLFGYPAPGRSWNLEVSTR
jgi:vitamin B12 transporter